MPYQDSWLIIMSTSKAMTQHCMQWLSHTSNYARPWLITTNSSSHQNNYLNILFTTAHLNTVRDSSSKQLFKHAVYDSLSKHCSGQLIRVISKEYCSRRTIIQEPSKVHYYSSLFHFWHGFSPSSTRNFNNSRLSAEVINTRFNLYRPFVHI